MALGRGRVVDRPGAGTPDRRPRVAREAEGRGSSTRCRGTRDRHRRVDRLLRPLYRDQGRLPVDRVRNADARAQPDLPLAPPLRGNRALPGATRRTLVGRRRGRVLCVLPRPLDAVLAGAVPQLRGARPRDRRVRKPHPPVANSGYRARSDRGHGRRYGRPGAAPTTSQPAGRRRRGGTHGGIHTGLDRYHPGLRGPRREPLLPAALQHAPETCELARSVDAGSIRRLSRTGDPRRESGEPARVLEPFSDRVWALDGSAPGPGRRRRPTSRSRTGRSRTLAPTTC